MQLVSGDPELMNFADVAFAVAGTISRSADRAELRATGDQFEAAVKEFIHAAAMQIPAARQP